MVRVDGEAHCASASPRATPPASQRISSEKQDQSGTVILDQSGATEGGYTLDRGTSPDDLGSAIYSAVRERRLPWSCEEGQEDYGRARRFRWVSVGMSPPRFREQRHRQDTGG